MSALQELEIEGLAAGGDGVGRAADGRVVFVPFTAPGDRVRVRIDAERPRHLHGTAVELLVPGPGRTDPLCAVFGSCGGCAWQHLDLETQVAWKARILRDAFLRIAKLAVPEPLRVRPSPSPYGTRCRARVLVRGGRAGFRRRRSHAVCATARCPILVPELDAALAGLARRPPLREGEIELTAGSEGEVSIAPLPADAGGRPVHVRVGSDRLRISPGVFVQAHAGLREALTEWVVAAAGEGERLLELCAGAGLFTLPLARRFERVVAVESDARALGDLRANLEAAAAAGVSVRGEPLEVALAGTAVADLLPQVVVLDPPRVGIGEAAADALARLCAGRVVYVSCDPATLARDVAVLADRGYALVALEGFDLFPQTPHLEAVAVLERA